MRYGWDDWQASAAVLGFCFAAGNMRIKSIELPLVHHVHEFDIHPIRRKADCAGLKGSSVIVRGQH
jgi:hypothetical protein